MGLFARVLDGARLEGSEGAAAATGAQQGLRVLKDESLGHLPKQGTY